MVRTRTCRSGAQRTVAVHGVPLRHSLSHLFSQTYKPCSPLPPGPAHSTRWSAGAPPACGACGAAAGARSGDPLIQRPGALRWLKLPSTALLEHLSGLRAPCQKRSSKTLRTRACAAGNVCLRSKQSARWQAGKGLNIFSATKAIRFAAGAAGRGVPGAAVRRG